MYACNAPCAAGGGSPAQTRSASSPGETGRPGVMARAATIERGLRAPMSTGMASSAPEPSGRPSTRAAPKTNTRTGTR